MSRLLRGVVVAAVFSTLAACANLGGARDAPLRPPVVTDPAPIVSGTMRPYQIRGRWYRPAEQPNYDEIGMASWYGAQHNGRPTSTGERFDMTALTAAHKTLPLPSLVEVTNRANGRRVILRVNDRGPFVDSRIIDLSRAAAEELGLLSQGAMSGERRARAAEWRCSERKPQPRHSRGPMSPLPCPLRLQPRRPPTGFRRAPSRIGAPQGESPIGWGIAPRFRTFAPTASLCFG